MLFILLLLAQTARAQPEASWSTDQTQHFTIHHESLGSPLGDYNRIERIYDALHPDLWQLVPWMTQNKVHVYLYNERGSFLKGRFHPPPWSGGLMAEPEGEKSLAVFQPLDTAIIAHELTHLYFHAFFDENTSQPPVWLDEGLAGMLQGDALTLPDPHDKGPVLLSPIAMKAFMKSRPSRDTPGAWVTAWYQQAHSVVRFIKRAHIDGVFAAFCGKLRGGADAETALREVYGYPDLAAFEQAWLKWRPKKAKGELLGPEDR